MTQAFEPDTVAGAINGLTVEVHHEVGRALRAIANNLWSPNVSDSNGESANVVDALAHIAAALYAVADALTTATRGHPAPSPPPEPPDIADTSPPL